MKRVLVLVLLCAGCLDGIDPAWQLDHDRLVAVRATPPHLLAGEVAQLDALVAHAGGPTDVEAPILATAAGAPAGLSSSVHFDNGVWEVVGPDDAQLDQARTELGLDPGAPVPLAVTVRFPDSNGHKLIAKKAVWLGDTHANPALGAVTIGGAPPGGDLTVPADTDVALAVDAADDAKVNWLTSCGTLHDDDEHAAILHVAPEDPQQGELAVVVRDPDGGVVWQVWSIAAR